MLNRFAILEHRANGIIIGVLAVLFSGFYISQLFLFSDGAFLAIKAYAAYFQNTADWYPLNIDDRFQRIWPHLIMQLPVYLMGLIRQHFTAAPLSFTEFNNLYALTYSAVYLLLYAAAIWLQREITAKYMALLIFVIQLPVFWIFSYETHFLLAMLLIIAGLLHRQSNSMLIMALLLNLAFIHEFYGFGCLALLTTLPNDQRRNRWLAVTLIAMIMIDIASWLAWPAGKFGGQYDQGIWLTLHPLLEICWPPTLALAWMMMVYFWDQGRLSWRYGCLAIAGLSWITAQAICGDNHLFIGLSVYRFWAFFLALGMLIAFFRWQKYIRMPAFALAVSLGLLLNTAYLSALLISGWHQRQLLTSSLDQQSRIKLVEAGENYTRFLPMFTIAFSGDHFCQLALNRADVMGNLHHIRRLMHNGDHLLTIDSRAYPWLQYSDPPTQLYITGLDGKLLDANQLPMFDCPPEPMKLLQQ